MKKTHLYRDDNIISERRTLIGSVIVMFARNTFLRRSVNLFNGQVELMTVLGAPVIVQVLRRLYTGQRVHACLYSDKSIGLNPSSPKDNEPRQFKKTLSIMNCKINFLKCSEYYFSLLYSCNFQILFSSSKVVYGQDSLFIFKINHLNDIFQCLLYY